MKILNKKASHNYEVIESMEAGVVLTGAEVKSIKSGRANMTDSFAKIINGELYLVNVEIPKYKYDGSSFYDPRRSRKLLVNKKQLVTLASKMKAKNLVMFPLSIYDTHGKIKVEIALGRGMKRHEKKDKEKERTLDRELLRESREVQ